jgi:hypothetical protein
VYEEGKGILKCFKEDFPLRDHSEIHILNIDGCGVDLLRCRQLRIHVTGFVRTKEGGYNSLATALSITC